MEVALTPLEFARRTRRLYGDRTGVVDGELRLTYEEFFARCDRWAAALQDLGIRHATDIAGGFRAWAAAGLPVEPPALTS